MLGVREPFFHKLGATVDELMGAAYPELTHNRELVDRALKAVEGRFAETLDSGMRIFDEVAARSGGTIPGADAFDFYDTYGFPVDLTAGIPPERGLTLDLVGCAVETEEQRETA